MSNHLAFATVTFVLQRLLDRAVRADVNGASASAVRPDGTDGNLPGTGVNVYLYQAVPTGDLGNFDAPTRDAGGNLIQRPVGVFDLVYLLTFYGQEANLEPQRVQASALRYITSEPRILKQAIRSQLQTLPGGHFLANTNLADQPTIVHLKLLKTSFEDFSHIWATFSQINYSLTSLVKAEVVMLDMESAGRESLPVRNRGVYGVAFGALGIDSVTPNLVPFAANGTILLNGRGFSGANVRFQIGDADASVVPNTLTGSAVRLRLPAGIRAGVTTVRAVDSGDLGAGHVASESNVVPIMILPVIQTTVYNFDNTPARDHTITVTALPQIGIDQKATLLLNRTDAPPPNTPAAYSMDARPRTNANNPLIFPARDVADGTYLVRLRVDGAVSELALDPNAPEPKPFTGPTLTIP
ncbi:MAG: DUF4255 domain-containing protein [Fimbriimonadaceae bacterium]|nr:DUF4255 domain-containing protein [Fimbriimonadaceae bacterium]